LLVLPSLIQADPAPTVPPTVPSVYYYAGSAGNLSNFSVGYFKKTSESDWMERGAE